MVPISSFWYKNVGSGILFRKIDIRSGIPFRKSGIRNGYVFDVAMAGLRPKVGQVHPPPGTFYRSLCLIGKYMSPLCEVYCFYKVVFTLHNF